MVKIKIFTIPFKKLGEGARDPLGLMSGHPWGGREGHTPLMKILLVTGIICNLISVQLLTF